MVVVHMAGKRTLLVDPDDQRREATVVMLKLAHINALTASNGERS